MQAQNKTSLPRVAVICPLDPSVPTIPSSASLLTTVDIEAII